MSRTLKTELELAATTFDSAATRTLDAARTAQVMGKPRTPGRVPVNYATAALDLKELKLHLDGAMRTLDKAIAKFEKHHADQRAGLKPY
jgi:hypothetical protein